MIISASRRTDIPAFYTPWFMNRIREGYCLVKNPFNPHQVSRVSLGPEDVECIVFWTRKADPMLHFLPELDDRGFRYYFLYTLVDYPGSMEPRSDSLEENIISFRNLSRTIGADRVVWRYDPILISSGSGFRDHIKRFQYIASRLEGFSRRVIISMFDAYPKAVRRLKALSGESTHPGDYTGLTDAPGFSAFISAFRESIERYGMEAQTCAENLSGPGWAVPRGKCIDDELILRIFGIPVPSGKDPGQRKECRCIRSKDIGAYNTCPRGCLYCYATSNPVLSEQYHRNHRREYDFLG